MQQSELASVGDQDFDRVNLPAFVRRSNLNMFREYEANQIKNWVYQWGRTEVGLLKPSKNICIFPDMGQSSIVAANALGLVVKGCLRRHSNILCVLASEVSQFCKEDSGYYDKLMSVGLLAVFGYPFEPRYPNEMTALDRVISNRFLHDRRMALGFVDDIESAKMKTFLCQVNTMATDAMTINTELVFVANKEPEETVQS